jgi:hypothetical protein
MFNFYVSCSIFYPRLGLLCTHFRHGILLKPQPQLTLDPRPVFRELSGNVQGIFRERSGNIQVTLSLPSQNEANFGALADLVVELVQGTFREDLGNIRGTFREHSGDTQGTFRAHSGHTELTLAGWANFGALADLVVEVVQGTFREHSGNIQGTFREQSRDIQGTLSLPSQDEANFGALADLVVEVVRARPATLLQIARSGKSFREHSGNNQGTFSAHSGNIQGTLVRARPATLL